MSCASRASLRGRRAYVRIVVPEYECRFPDKGLTRRIRPIASKRKGPLCCRKNRCRSVQFPTILSRNETVRGAWRHRLAVSCPRPLVVAGPQTAYRHLVLENRDNSSVVGFVDHDIADDLTTKEIAGELSDLVAQRQKQDIVLDLSGVVGVSSTMLEKLLAIACAMEERGRDLRLCKVGPEVRRILAAKKLDHMFGIEEDRVRASNALSRDRIGGNGVATQLFVSSQSSIPRPKPQVSPRVRAVARKHLIEPSAK